MPQKTVPAALPVDALPIQFTIDEFEQLYPTARYDLNFSTPLDLLVAAQLAAQCTDKRVNSVTRQLFQKYRVAEDYVAVPVEELEEDVKLTGFYRKKARQIQAACQYLLLVHQGEVPQTIEELVKVPGVARKTANVILGSAFGIVDGFIIDTHVGRLAKRFGWTQQDDPVKVERELMRLVPREHWLSLAHRMIYHGRAVCVARKPHCEQCTLAQLCPASSLPPTP
ncbi:endonuclease III [Dictyobacter alpinus]|nr:endonuclease III [Dictyobacter alpinus]